MDILIFIAVTAALAAALYFALTNLMSFLGRLLETYRLRKTYEMRWASIQVRLESDELAVRRAAAKEALRLNQEGPYKKRRP